MSNQEINTKYEKQVGQNLMGSVESLERQVGSVGQPGMLYKSSISHSGCGIGSHKSISSVDIKRSNPEFNINSKGNKRTQLSHSLSSSLSHSEGDRKGERDRGMFYTNSSECGTSNYNMISIKLNELM